MTAPAGFGRRAGTLAPHFPGRMPEAPLRMPEATLRAAHPAQVSPQPVLRPIPAAVTAAHRALRLVEEVQSAQRRPVPVLADALVIVATLAVIAGPAAGLVGSVVFVAGGLAFGVWRRRSVVEAQGVGWYARPVLQALLGLRVALWCIHPTAWGTGSTLATDAVVAAGAAVVGLHAVLWLVIGSSRRRGTALHPTLLVGPAGPITEVAGRMGIYPEAGLAAVATHVPCARSDAEVDGRAAVDRLLREHAVEHVVCVADERAEALLRQIVRFSDGRVDCSLVLPLGGLAAGSARVHLGDYGLVPIALHTSWGSNATKRVIDITVAGVLLAVLSPLLAATALAVRLGDPGPAIFRQRRVGTDGRLFTCLKFRSMVLDAEDQRQQYLGDNVSAGLLFKIDRDPRVTRVGSWIRRTSVDELPQLWNVVRGDMSLVGPRPLPVQPQEFDVRAEIRHIVKPGITGLWQVLGANALDYDAMVDLDLTYVTSHSLGTDLRILARTVSAVLVRRAAY